MNLSSSLGLERPGIKLLKRWLIVTARSFNNSSRAQAHQRVLFRSVFIKYHLSCLILRWLLRHVKLMTSTFFCSVGRFNNWIRTCRTEKKVWIIPFTQITVIAELSESSKQQLKYKSTGTETFILLNLLPINNLLHSSISTASTNTACCFKFYISSSITKCVQMYNNKRIKRRRLN